MNPFEPNELVCVIAGEVARPTAHEPVPTEICRVTEVRMGNQRERHGPGVLGQLQIG
jgi:hypothetical protein